MNILLRILPLLSCPVLVYCQHYKANYLCDFETSDCGFHAESDTGAYFVRGAVHAGNRKTYGLVLGDLPENPNWSSTKTRAAYVWSPAIFPATLFKQIFISLDYFVKGGACVDFIQLSQAAENGTRAVGKSVKFKKWDTIEATVEDTKQPLKLVVEAYLKPTCHSRKQCKCSGSAIVDNLRITSSDMPTSSLEYTISRDKGAGNTPTDPELTLSAIDVAFQELAAADRKLTKENLEEIPADEDYSSIPAMNEIERLDIVTGHNPYPGTKSIPPVPRRKCPPAPTCPVHFEFPRHCPITPVKECHYFAHPNFCQCQYVNQCATYRCPNVLPCPPEPPCPQVVPWDPKSWDPKRYHRLGLEPLRE